MRFPPIPDGEVERLRALTECGILDTAAEESFDSLTALAAHICQAPISLITFQDADRQWFKSRFGLQIAETPRHDAFCAYAIMQPGLFVVPDARDDDRFASNPLVVGEPHIRFYAGAPLVMSSGHILGTLCVIDRVPRHLHEEHRQALHVLAQHVVSHLELRIRTNQLRQSHAEVQLLNHELAERSSTLQSSNSALQSFSYSVAHDLRAPLRSICGYAGMLMEDHEAELSLDAVQKVMVINDRANAMNQIIDALLTLARVSSHQLVKSLVDVESVIHEIIGQFAEDIRQRSIEVRIGDMPPCMGDKTLLRQMFFNVIGNSIKYTGKTPLPRIDISAIQSPSGITYKVSDNGSGFDMRFVGKLFGTLQRLHKSDEFPGMGIGLATAKRIVEIHAGCISASGEVGHGATFSMTIPIAASGDPGHDSTRKS